MYVRLAKRSNRRQPRCPRRRNCGLAGSNGALRFVERDNDLVRTRSLDHRWGRFVAMPNLNGHAHGLVQIVNRNQVYASGAQGARVKMLFSAHNNLLVRAADLDDV